MSDTLTILTSLDKPCTKRFELLNGEMRQHPIGMAYKFNASEQEIDGLDDLGRALSALEANCQVAIIRGKSVDALPVRDVRRRNENFQAEPRQWCLIDIDELLIPKGLEDFKSHLPELVENSIQQLPAEFQNVHCWYQFSSSMGIKQGKIRIHLWFWLSRKVADIEMKAWLCTSPADLHLFQPVQMHYIAKPMFNGGAIDPLPHRSGTHRASAGKDTVNVPDDLSSRARAVSSRPKHIRSGGIVEGQEIIRDSTSGLAIDGREQLLFGLSNEVTEELVRARANKLVPTAQEIADRLWERFLEEADIRDDKWTEAEALEKASARYKEIEEGSFKFTARGGGNTLFPSQKPYYQLDLVTKEEGQQRLEGVLTDFFSLISEGNTPRYVVKITMGSGKTTQTIQYLKSFLGSQSNKLVEIYVPRHDIANEYENKLSIAPAVNAEVIHVYPRTGGQIDPQTGKPQFEPLCSRSEYVRSLEEAGHSVFQSACQSGESGTCEHFNTCEYLKQFRQQAMPMAPAHNGNIIRIYQHAQLGLPRNWLEDEQSPDLIVVDESFLPSLLDTSQSVSAEDLRAHLKAPDALGIGNLVVDALRDSTPVLRALRAAGVVRSDLDRIQIDALNLSQGFDGNRSSPKALQNNKKYRKVSNVIRILSDEWGTTGRDQVERLTYDPKKRDVGICSLKTIRIPKNVPLLILDATADEGLIEKVVGPVNFKQIDIEQRAVVTQVYDHTGSNTWWNDHPERVNELVAVLNEWVNYGETPLCVSHKKLADTLLKHGELNDQVKVLNFGGVRGSNAAENCSVTFITGRNQLPPTAVDQKARALFWEEEIELKHDDQDGDLPKELRGYLLSERYKSQQAGVQVRAFSDPRIERLHAQEREAETIQAIARLRLVHSKTMKRVFLLGNLPIEMPVDRLVTFDELMPDGLERELLDKRNLPITALGIVRMRPDITELVNTAKQKLRRSSVTDYETLAAVLPDLAKATILIARFRAGDGRKTLQTHLFIPKASLPDRDVVVGSAPAYVETKAFLETGWGEIEDLRIEFWGGVNVIH
ncbi:hypothetical protein [Pseudopelagicola sp. nBUS_19]|uniref:hypothetical protein n=1 Tax=Pseudopelagicola sp. nBUS_19 TaxID=3395316 RepID=UPI003EB849AD